MTAKAPERPFSGAQLPLTSGSPQRCKSTLSVRDGLRVRMLFPGLSRSCALEAFLPVF